MKNNYEKLENSLNVSTNIVPLETPIVDIEIESNYKDLKKDYEYTRSNLYSLIEKGQEAINGIMELAEEGGSPRAYEVAGQLIKSVGDVTDKLIDLQKKLKDLNDNTIKTTNNVTNNAVFVGSTTELSKLLKNGFINNKE
tara:strand:- start:755 stop:1174 length:420 start_codon:yes stop_codon:yes gene_type:complete